ncbi:hypothetical protein [uncultured Thermanaerothrix sp.]|uniref:hypothetical protein n=1 Tax=uncultured Thermanaerothrix sp. TaxID=1195149 RepID=UPI002628BA85|nr:hypothetical protein [uncultured Thermanaerothrix sp.]
MKERIYTGLRIVASLLGLGLLALAGWPSANSRVVLKPDLTWLRNNGEAAGGLPDGILESIEKTDLVFRWPQRLRVGESGSIRLSWEPRTPSSSSEDLISVPTRFMVATRLEVSGGGRVTPIGMWREVVDMRKPTSLNWEVVALEKTSLQGTLWVYVHNPQDANQGLDLPILAWSFTISVDAPLGLPRWALGLLGGLLMGMSLIRNRQS